jgi:trehalose 6-phosphate synthase
MSKARPLVLVSNRGPVTFQPGGEMKRGTGGLVTALTGLASHREVLWVASAMTDEDVEHSEQHGGRAFEIESAHGGSTFQVRLVASDPNAYDRFYNVFANPMLWFIQHYLWDLSNAPDIRRNEVEAFEYGYNVVNEDLAAAVLEEIDGAEDPVVMVHDYHLYTLPGARPARAAGRVPAPLHPHPVDPARRVARAAARDPPRDLRGAAVQRHRRVPHALVPLELPAVLPRPDGPRRRLRAAGVVQFGDREVWVRAYPLPIDARATAGSRRPTARRSSRTSCCGAGATS